MKTYEVKHVDTGLMGAQSYDKVAERLTEGVNHLMRFRDQFWKVVSVAPLNHGSFVYIVTMENDTDARNEYMSRIEMNRIMLERATEDYEQWPDRSRC